MHKNPFSSKEWFNKHTLHVVWNFQTRNSNMNIECCKEKVRRVGEFTFINIRWHAVGSNLKQTSLWDVSGSETTNSSKDLLNFNTISKYRWTLHDGISTFYNQKLYCVISIRYCYISAQILRSQYSTSQ